MKLFMNNILDSSEITDVTFIVVNNNCSILAVGWDKHVNVFKDDRERIKQVCYPEDRFQGENPNEGHQEDILCIDKSPGDLIATGDYGGRIVIWNMSSKKVFATLKENKENIENNQLADGKRKLGYRYFSIYLSIYVYKYKENANDRIISRVKFIDQRFGRHDAANLVAAGPHGQIHFWNIYKNGVLMAKFRPVNVGE